MESEGYSGNLERRRVWTRPAPTSEGGERAVGWRGVCCHHHHHHFLHWILCHNMRIIVVSHQPKSAQPLTVTMPRAADRGREETRSNEAHEIFCSGCNFTSVYLGVFPHRFIETRQDIAILVVKREARGPKRARDNFSEGGKKWLNCILKK